MSEIKYLQTEPKPPPIKTKNIFLIIDHFFKNNSNEKKTMKPIKTQ